VVFTIKQISKKEIEKLVENNFIINRYGGYRDKRGNEVGFYRTKNKRYIEDKYVAIAQKLN
jgi:hypothetical protein